MRRRSAFGESAEQVTPLARAYVESFQSGTSGVDSTGAEAVITHCVDYGAARDGYDSHAAYGRFALIGDDQLDRHVAPFPEAFAANVAAVMPT